MSGQLALDERWTITARPGRPKSTRREAQPGQASEQILCAGCRAGEARYGFRDEHDDDPTVERPRTLCFECFRAEIGRRQAVATRLARGEAAGSPTRTPARWGANATQVNLPLEETLKSLTHRRRRAQIAARHALEAS